MNIFIFFRKENTSGELMKTVEQIQKDLDQSNIYKSNFYNLNPLLIHKNQKICLIYTILGLDAIGRWERSHLHGR